MPEDVSVNILKFTISTNMREALQAARKRESEKPPYLQLINDLEVRGLPVSFKTLENGSLGHYAPYAIKCLTCILGLLKQLAISTKTITDLCRMVLSHF